ncbi:MAG TPA: glycosyltransferase family 1 protein [Caulobacteraceae bacterium]|nr:glycosyltransferase family 1 protein [Caulobacteraceae bacterium]
MLFDTTRLAWRARRGSPTGIDRVVGAYAAWLAARSDLELVPVALAGESLVRVSPSRLALPDPPLKGAEAWPALQRALAIDAPSGPAVRRPMAAQNAADWAPLAMDMAARMLASPFAGVGAGPVYINVAHTGLHRDGLWAFLKRRRIRPVIMVHDLIPITHPEFCTPSAGPRHRQRIDNVIDGAALVIANSRNTAEALQAYAHETGRQSPPIEVAHLGLAERFLKPNGTTPGRRPYFVFVGTIEARKNLAFLLTVWRRIAETLGEDAPHLVLVGRRGWENEAVIDHLERSPRLQNLVHEAADLSDDQLAWLLGGARGLLAPSLAEGFDLPPIEALSLGTPVIASDIAVHRELSAGAKLIDPLDGPTWAAAIAAACESSPTRRPRPGPTWAEHFERVGPRLSALLEDDG